VAIEVGVGFRRRQGHALQIAEDATSRPLTPSRTESKPAGNEIDMHMTAERA
jgi:hypothetical protein